MGVGSSEKKIIKIPEITAGNADEREQQMTLSI